MPFEIIRKDIIKMRVDAIVNAANSSLAAGGGVCGAIFQAAGYEQLDAACRSIGRCAVGQAVITAGFSLSAKYVIHAVGPIWQGGTQNEAALLESCYTSALQLAVENHCRSIAFPLISAGIFGYPKEEALQIAVSTISSFVLNHEIQVYLVVRNRSAVVLSEKLLGPIQRYIDDHYVDIHPSDRWSNAEAAYQRQQLAEQSALYSSMGDSMPAPAVPAKRKRSLKDLLKHLDETFSQMLLRLIDEKGMTDVEVYKRANLDRKLFSKIRKGNGYHPSKITALSLAIALRLNLDETVDLLNRAGYALSHSSKFDVIIEYFIQEGIYEIYEINEALFAFDQPLLGG